MGLLVGLPLKIFYLLFVVLRLALPLILLLAVFFILRSLYRRRTGQAKPCREDRTEPNFKGPVYTVDYEEVDETEESR